MDDLSGIQRRIAQLEKDLAEVKAIVQRAARQQAEAPAPPPATTSTARPAPPPRRSLVGSLLWSHGDIPGRRPPGAAPAQPVARPPFPAPIGRTSSPPARPRALRSGEFEANLLGSWFARIGIFAIFLGAVFAFKYAVDRDLITEAGRVAVGVFAGLAFIVWGEWAYRKSWPLFAQAVAGGGVAIMYLAVWAGYQLYQLTSPGATLVLLALVVVTGGALAVRHGSMALAVMAALGGFLNPLLVSTGRGSVTALNLYLLFLNAGILGLALYRRWRALTVVALTATWLLAFLGLWDAGGGRHLVALGFAGLFFAAFHATLLHPYLKTEAAATEQDLLVTSLNSLALFAFGMTALSGTAETFFALAVGLVHIGIGLGWRAIRRRDTGAVLTFLGLGIGAATVAAALQFEGSILATIWAVEAVAIMLASVHAGLSRLRVAGLVVLTLSVGLSLLQSGLGVFYAPARPIFSAEALPFVTQIAGLAGIGMLLRRRGESPAENRAAEAAEALAVVLAGAWLTFELAAQYQRAGWALRTLPYAIASFWAFYAAATAAAGAVRRAGWARPLGLSIFGLSVATSMISSGLGAAYRPARALVSVESLAFVLQIAILGASAVTLRRRTEAARPGAADSAAVAGNLLALLWLTFELWAHYERPGAPWTFATFTFTLSTTWTLYAAGLLAFGIGARAKWARLMAVALFGLVIAKLVLADVWLLHTPLRIAALMGLGLVLLLSSLGYHRFRALVLGPEDPGGAGAGNA